MTREELINQIAALLAEYQGWDVPEDYKAEANIMVSHLERVWYE